MFDLGMSELLVIGVVALIVIGPKDLPQLFRSLGKFTAKARSMAREFSRAMEAAADEAGVKDVARDLKDVTSAKSMGLDKVREAAEKFEKWDPMKNAARPSGTARPATVTSAAKSPDAAAASAPADEKPRGPNTAALAEKQAARKAAVQEATEKLKKTSDAPATAAATSPAASSAPAPAARPDADPTPEPPKAKA